MYETVNERVDVAVVFGKDPRRTQPLKLLWNGCEYRISKVGYRHKFKDGRDTVHVFSCTGSTSFFELHFNASSLTWTLKKVWNGAP